VYLLSVNFATDINILKRYAIIYGHDVDLLVLLILRHSKTSVIDWLAGWLAGWLVGLSID